MTRFRRPTPALGMVLLALAGAAAILVGTYMLLGLAPALIGGGVAAVVTALLADV